MQGRRRGGRIFGRRSVASRLPCGFRARLACLLSQFFPKALQDVDMIFLILDDPCQNGVDLAVADGLDMHLILADGGFFRLNVGRKHF